MLSYRHSYHAGNFADVLKHLCLLESLVYLTQKAKPLFYLDTHSGCAAYNLTSPEALKTEEFRGGIGKLWQQDDLPEPLQRYVELIRAYNPEPSLSYYPGSPWIAQQQLRAEDRLFFCELHPNEQQALRNNIGKDARIKVRAEDGLQALVSLMPPKEKRALVLIDPSYEIKRDYTDVVRAIKAAHKRFATGTYALWYPVVERSRIDQMEQEFKQSGIRNIQLFELGVADDNQPGMTSSGMIIINPPWTLKQTMESCLPLLAQTLAPTGQGFYRSEQLVEE